MVQLAKRFGGEMKASVFSVEAMSRWNLITLFRIQKVALTPPETFSCFARNATEQSQIRFDQLCDLLSGFEASYVVRLVLLVLFPPFRSDVFRN